MNQMRAVPRAIGRLIQLNHLDLSDNRLREIPIEIGRLQQLRELNILRNQIIEIPDEILELEQLLLRRDGNGVARAPHIPLGIGQKFRPQTGP